MVKGRSERPHRLGGVSVSSAAGGLHRGLVTPGIGPPASRATLRMERDGFRLAIFLVIIVALGQVHLFLGIAALRPALLLAVGAVALAILNPGVVNRRAMFRTWPPKVMAGLGIMACISVPFGMSIGGSSAFIIEVYSKSLMTGLLVVLAIRHARDLYTLVWAVVLSGAWLAFLSVFIVRPTTGQALTYTSYDPNDVGLVLLVCVPLALALFQSASSKLVRAVSLLTVLGAAATIAISGSRGSFVGILALGVALLVLLKGISVAKRLALVAVAAGALAVAAPEGYWTEMETITDPNDYNLHAPFGRKAIWKRGIGYMLDNPITGLGINNFGRAEGLVSEPAMLRRQTGGGPIKWSAAHNSFLEPAAEMGFPGLILFASLVFGGLISMLRLRKRLPPTWKRGDPQQRFLHHMALYLPVSFVAFSATGFFLSFAYVGPIYVLAGFVAGMYTSVEVKLREGGTRGRPPIAPSPRPPGRRRPGWREPGRVGAAARVSGAATHARRG